MFISSILEEFSKKNMSVMDRKYIENRIGDRGEPWWNPYFADKIQCCLDQSA